MTWTAQDQSNINYARRKTSSTRPPSAKSEVIEDTNTFSQTLIRELPEFRAYCGRAFTEYQEIRHPRGNLKLMTEATCQVDYAGNWQVDYASTWMR